MAALLASRDNIRPMTPCGGLLRRKTSRLSRGKGVPSMCDYSLHHVATRPARIEDKLVTTKFSSSTTRGFAAAGEPHVAVCLLPGTEIAFDENVECEPSIGLGILPNKKIGQRLARFRQINVDNPVAHHDALEFPDGQVVLVTRLCQGQRATVLQLPIATHPAAAEEAVRREVREPSLLAGSGDIPRDREPPANGGPFGYCQRFRPRLPSHCPGGSTPARRKTREYGLLTTALHPSMTGHQSGWRV